MSLVTIMNRENMYTKKDRAKAIEAGEFIKNSVYSTKEEAIALVRDGNIENVPHTVEDIKRYYDIYGQDPEFHKGRATKSNPKRKVRFDEGVREQIKVQTLYTDVMHLFGNRYLVSLAVPLQLIISTPTGQRIEVHGKVLMTHIELLQSKGL